jgi:hypothetical protein
MVTITLTLLLISRPLKNLQKFSYNSYLQKVKDIALFCNFFKNDF